jgi:peptide/nickel transport system ATP-binding protein
MMSDITISHLSVTFETSRGPVFAVRDLNTVFRAGQISGVIGESGSGKSVMGMSILRLLPNNAHVEGTCLYENEDLYTVPLRRLRQVRGGVIGLIPQNPGASLDPIMRIRRQITETIEAHDRKSGRRTADARAAELLRSFGFDEAERILDRYSFQMSGGMNQRLVSALGLACQPGWIIADEPTKGLDAVIRNQVYQVLRQICQEGARSMIVITHDLMLARRLCDDIRVMYMGQIIEQGPAENVMETPRHPYTQGLIASLPSRGMQPIPQADPARAADGGCPFYPRCARASSRCAAAQPGELPRPGGGSVRCFLYE